MSDIQGASLGVQVIPAGWQDHSADRVYSIASLALGLASTGLPVPGARMVEGSDGSLYLQIDEQGDAAAPTDWAWIVDQTRQMIEDPGHREDEPERAPLDDQAAIELLERIEAVWLARSDLAPHIEFDDEQPALVLAPDEADWSFVVVPAPWPEAVRALLPLSLLPDDPEAQVASVRQALQANDQRSLGAACSIGVDVEADLLLLQCLVRPAQMDMPGWAGVFGQMLALREALLEHWGGANEPDLVSGSAPIYAGGLPLTALRG